MWHIFAYIFVIIANFGQYFFLVGSVKTYEIVESFVIVINNISSIILAILVNKILDKCIAMTFITRKTAEPDKF